MMRALKNWYPLIQSFYTKLCEWVLFLLLLPFEYLYRAGFFINQTYKKYRGNKTGYPFKIISVGNVTVGGTGKSVVIPFVAKLLGEDRCAIVMRGYGGSQERSPGAILVGDGKDLLCSVAIAGDEAVMHATQLRCPVVVGASRADACDLLVDMTALPRSGELHPSTGSGGAEQVAFAQQEQNGSHAEAGNQKKLEIKTSLFDISAHPELVEGRPHRGGRAGSQQLQYILLDDAYQHHSVKKDIDIVLLDARKPFDNGYCLPAGRLREKDLSRAHIIMMTHTDQLALEQRQALQKKLEKRVGKKLIFWGRHAVDGLYRNNEELVSAELLTGKKIMLVAGIGTPKNIQQSLDYLGIVPIATMPFPNHAPYRERDLEAIAERAQQAGATAVVTTIKDWVKLAPFVLRQGAGYGWMKWYVLRVRYEFLDNADKGRLVQILQQK